MPTPITSTDASFCWDDLIFTRTSGASKGLLQKPDLHNHLSSFGTLSHRSSRRSTNYGTKSQCDLESNQHGYIPALHKSALPPLGDHLLQGNPLNFASAITPNSASQKVIESHASLSPNGVPHNSQRAPRGIFSHSAEDPSPSLRGSVNVMHTLPVSALKEFKRNSSLSDSSTTFRRNHSESNTFITTKDKRDTDVIDDGTDSALQSVLQENFSPNHGFQKTLIPRTRKSSLSSMNSKGSSLDNHLVQGNPLNSYNANILKSENQNVTDLHALIIPNGFQHTSQRDIQGIFSLGAKYPSSSVRGSMNITHTLPVSALRDFKRNSSLSDLFTYENLSSSNSIQSSSSLNKELSQGENNRIPISAPRRTIKKRTAPTMLPVQLDFLVTSSTHCSSSLGEELSQDGHSTPFPALHRTILNGTASATQPVQLGSPVTSSSFHSSSSSDEKPSQGGHRRFPIPAPRRTIKQRTVPTMLPVQLNFLVTSSTHSSSSSNEELSQDEHSTPFPAPRRSIFQGTATAAHHVQLDSPVILTLPYSSSSSGEEQSQSKHSTPFPAPRRTIFQGTATAPHHVQLDLSGISTSPYSSSSLDEEQSQSRHITPIPAPRRTIIQGTASATHHVQLNLSVTSSSSHSSCSSGEEASQDGHNSTPFPAPCRKLKPVLLKRGFLQANPAYLSSDERAAQLNHRQLVSPCPMHDKPVKHNLGEFKQFHEIDASGNYALPNSFSWVNYNQLIDADNDVIKKTTEVRSQLPNLTHDTISFVHVSIHSDSVQPRTKIIPDFFIVSLRAGAIRISANKEHSIQSVSQEIQCHRSQFVITSYPFDPGGQL